MDINCLEAWKPNVVMEQGIMEGSLQRPGFFSRVWDLTIGPDGAFGIVILWLEAQKPIIDMEQNLMEDSLGQAFSLMFEESGT